MERLDKILAHQGLGTRKDVKKYIRKGRIRINGTICTCSDTKIDMEKDAVFFDDTELKLRSELYLMMNKPSGIVSSAKDGLHQTVFDLLEESYYRLFLSGRLHLVGRLDIDTEGLILLTTDGVFTHRITSPKSHISKTYFVKVRPKSNARFQHLTEDLKKSIKEQFLRGLSVPECGDEVAFDAQSAELEWNDEVDELHSCSLCIHEGKYHQVKRMFSAVGCKVVFLKRSKIGTLSLDNDLAIGDYREISKEELIEL